MGKIFNQNLEALKNKPKSEEDPGIAFEPSKEGDAYSYPLYSQFQYENKLGDDYNYSDEMRRKSGEEVQNYSDDIKPKSHEEQ